jgi:tRNA uridine 5-carbamoylmethylation protein Kti12
MTLKLVTSNDSVAKEPPEILHEASITAIIDAIGDNKALPVTPDVIAKIIQAYSEQGDRKKVRKIFVDIDDQRKAAGIITDKKSFVSELDTPEAVNTVDLLGFVDDKHLLKRLSLEIASVYHLPQSTVFLMGLGVFSSVSCRKKVVNYQDNKASLPIGLYVIAEQPSGVGKSRCLNTFENEFSQIHKSINTSRKKEINRLLKDKELNDGDLSEQQREELFELQNSKIPQLYTTNATPEGLERTLSDNRGFFAAISSEQGLFNSLFGKTYSNGSNNNDVVLNGFDAGFINVNRAGRDGYSGNVVGAVVCFAQQGSIETILDASQGTGLSERFLMLVEPHRLGQRDHKKINQLTERLLIEYSLACGFGLDVFNQPEDFSELTQLFITDKGFEMIADYQNEIEPHLRDGEKYSFPALRGVASKINMQIMKIAANLHLLDKGFFHPYIEDKHVESAIKIADRLLQHQLKMMRDKGIIGIKAEYQSILALFETNNLPLSYRQITEAKRKVNPFKDTQNPSDAIRNALAEMVQVGLLEEVSAANETGKVKTSYRLAQ